MEKTHTAPTAANAIIIKIADTCTDAEWFAHYQAEKARLSSVEGRAGTMAYAAQLRGDLDTRQVLRKVESAANVAGHVVNLAILEGGF